MMYGGGGMSAWGWVAMTIAMIGFWLLLIALLVAAVRLFGGHSGAGGGYPPPTAKEILDQRFARGEIDEAEYKDRLRALSGS